VYRKILPALALSVALSACDQGVTLNEQPVFGIADDGINSQFSDEPLFIDDTQARDFFSVNVNTTPQLTIAHVQCASDTDTITPDSMSYTNGFVRVIGTEDTPFESSLDSLRARNVVEQSGSQYIEVCVEAEFDRDYYIRTKVAGPSVREDSFFFTVGDGDPVIYDVKRARSSSDENETARSFSDDLVRSRDYDPLRVSLKAGKNLLRFHYRERNTELAELSFLRLPSENTGPVLTTENSDFSADILDCASSTGLDPELVSSLIAQHILTDDFSVIHLGNTNDFGETNYLETGGDFETATVFCLRSRHPVLTSFGFLESSNTVSTTLAATLILGSSGPDTLRTPLGDNVTFYGFDGDDTVVWQAGGQFFGGRDNDQVSGMSAGRFEGGTGNNSVRLATAQTEITNAAIVNFAVAPEPLSELEVSIVDDNLANVRWFEDTDAYVTIEGSNSPIIRGFAVPSGSRSTEISRNNGSTITLTGRSLAEHSIPANPSSDNDFDTVSLVSQDSASITFSFPSEEELSE